MTRRTIAICLLAALAACGASTGPDAGSPKLVAIGRLERGLSVRFAVVTGTDTTVADASAVTVSPATAATAQSDGSMLLVGAGALAVTLKLGSGTTVSSSFTVAAPPKILFDVIVGGNRDIYRVSLDGNDLERLTADQGDDVHPTMARGRVVFTSYRDGHAELYSLATTAGAADRRLTNSTANNTAPALSPDGQRLAYVRDDGTSAKVWVSASDATAAAPLTANFGFSASVEGSPTWSLRSDSLAIMATALGNASIFRVSASAGSSPAAAAKATGDASYVEPAWSSDGKRLAFVSASGTNPSQIAVLDLTSGTSTTLTHGPSPAGQPAWLPDGRLIFTLFTGNVGQLVWLDPSTPDAVHPIPLAGKDPERATANAP